METSSKSFLIIGGTSGIGAAISQNLLNGGHQVLSVSRGKSAIAFDQPNFKNIEADITDSPAINALDLPDELDGFAYCPGSIVLKPFTSLQESDFLEAIDINLMGAVRCFKAALPSLKKAESASALFFSTVAVQSGMPFHAAISSAKGAVEGLTRSLAAELAPKIQVNAIAPSLTDTPLAAGLLSSDQKRQALAERHPLKRIGTAEDIAGFGSKLIAGDVPWMTGQIIQIDGGLSAVR